MLKYTFYFLAVALLIACQPPTEDAKVNSTTEPIAKDLASQLQVDTSIFETFEIAEGDTSYLMKKYFMVFLKTGPNRDHGEEEAAKIQEAHLAHMARLAEEKKICIAGPFDSEGDIRGIVIYSATSLEEAKELTSNDPAVKAGRLTVEVHPFWAAVGSQLF